MGIEQLVSSLLSIIIIIIMAQTHTGDRDNY